MAACQEAIRIDPKDAKARYNLGYLLSGLGRREEAVAAYQQSISLDPSYAEAHCNLGHILRSQGRFAEALASLRQGHELGSKQPGWRYPSAQWVQAAEQLVKLDGKLSAVLKGEAEPANVPEKVQLAWLCQREYKRLYCAATRLYADAFTADPKFAADMQRQHRYNAASAATLAGCGQGVDTDKLSDEERAGLRQQALNWLHADLTHWSERSKSDKPQERAEAQKTLRHWQLDADLTGVRGDTLAKLPEAEAAAWKKLWAKVDALLKQLESKK
jgi:tetratricopeptide (TPR) repeat protein